LLDPTRLVEGAEKVYGRAEFQRIYGQIVPLPDERVQPMEHEADVAWGSRRLRFLHTRGHAKHHFCVVDTEDEAIYTGDAFGLVYPRLQHHGLFAMPSTTPTDFDPREARAAVRVVLASGARQALPTHFGPIAGMVAGMTQVAAQLLEHLEVAESVMHEARAWDHAGEALVEICRDRMTAHVRRCDERQGLALSRADWQMLDHDLQLNAQGIAHAIEKARGSS
jgi:glyoxylase-like metal-dependent hydrolase (beta-lactamase superfamily II)